MFNVQYILKNLQEHNKQQQNNNNNNSLMILLSLKKNVLDYYLKMTSAPT